MVWSILSPGFDVYLYACRQKPFSQPLGFRLGTSEKTVLALQAKGLDSGEGEVRLFSQLTSDAQSL